MVGKILGFILKPYIDLSNEDLSNECIHSTQGYRPPWIFWALRDGCIRGTSGLTRGWYKVF